MCVSGGGGQRGSVGPSPGWRRDGERECRAPQRLPTGGHLSGEELPQDPDPGGPQVPQHQQQQQIPELFSPTKPF